MGGRGRQLTVIFSFRASYNPSHPPQCVSLFVFLNYTKYGGEISRLINLVFGSIFCFRFRSRIYIVVNKVCLDGRGRRQDRRYITEITEHN